MNKNQTANHPRFAIKRRKFLNHAAVLAGATLAASHGAAAVAATKWQIGCYTRPWNKYDYRIALDAIAEAGYRFVGLMNTNTPSKWVISTQTTPDEARQVGQECKQHGLTIASAYCGGISAAHSLEAAIADLEKLIRNCAAAGARDLLMGGIGDPKLYDRYYKAIAECCPEAAQRGLGISVKPHGGLNANGTECRKAVEKVNHPNFRIWYDPGNIFFYSGGQLDPIDDAAAVDGLVAGMSVKDYLPPKNVNLTPGTGQVDFPKVMARLGQGGFTSGPLIVECLAPGNLEETLTQAKKTRRFLEELTQQLRP